MSRRVFCSVAVVILLLTAGCGTAGRKARAAGSPKPQPVRTPVVMFLGDSYTTGRLGQIPEQTYAAYTARILGWQVIIGGYRGTGYVSKGHIGKTFASLFEEQLAWRPPPGLLIIAGGHNDRRYRPENISAAAQRLFTSIREHWPKTHLLILGPMWGGDPDLEVWTTRDAVESVAKGMDIPFVDPLQERWIIGDRTLGTDRKSVV